MSNESKISESRIAEYEDQMRQHGIVVGSGENGEPFFPEIEVQLSGNDGNAYAIMGAVKSALHRAGVPGSVLTAYSEESMSGDYDHLLVTAMRWVAVS